MSQPLFLMIRPSPTLSHCSATQPLRSHAEFKCRLHMASIETSVVNPNILNLDLDPEFWQNLDPDPWLPVIDLEKN